MWQYLFLQKAIDCPIEHKAYCRLYHICFGGREQYDEWIELNSGRKNLERELKKLDDEKKRLDEAKKKEDGEKKKKGQELFTDKGTAENLDEKEKARTKKWLESELAKIKESIRVRREVAVVRGAVEANRIEEGEALYGDEDEPGAEEVILPQPPPLSQ